MTDVPDRLSFTLANYGHQQAAKRLTSRLWSPVQRHAFVVFLGGLGIWLGGLILLVWAVGPLPEYLAYLGPLVLWVWLIIIGVRKRKRCWEAVASSPTLSGPATLQIDPSGVTFTTRASRLTVAWVPGVDVIKAPDGLLITLGGASYLPIPASAFANAAAQDAFLARARTFAAPPESVFS